MISLHFLRLGVAAALWFGAQEPQGSFEALKEALGLSDVQVVGLQQNFLLSRQQDIQRVSRAELRIVIHVPTGMDDSHKARLSEIAKILERTGTASLAIDIGLILQEQWPGGADSMCHYPLAYYASSPHLSDFGMTRSQIEQLAGIIRVANEPLWAQVREKAMQRQVFLDSGVNADSPALVQLGSDSNRLQKQISAKPPRDLARSVLDAAQQAKLAEFEKELDLAREAVELGLIFDPHLYGEVLCR